jgi:hypothetical protein
MASRMVGEIPSCTRTTSAVGDSDAPTDTPALVSVLVNLDAPTDAPALVSVLDSDVPTNTFQEPWL